MREIIARALYDRERARALHTEAVLSAVKGKPITDTMEPWEECKDVFLGDADAAIEAICENIGWPQIRAYRDELAKGQDVHEDGGGYFARAIGALFKGPSRTEIETYQQAAERMLRDAAR